MWPTLVVAVLSLAGAAVPWWFRPAHAQLQIYLSLAAGALLGAALFHLLPEASEHVHGGFGLPAVLGVMIVFLLQRYVAPHSHELSHVESSSHRVEECEHGEAGHVHYANEGEAHARLHAAEPFLSGAIAILALSIHSFFDGVAIGAAIGGGDQQGEPALMWAVFLSVMIHKPLDGLSVSVLLMNARVQTRTLWLIQFLYAALVPLGAAGFLLTRGSLGDPSAFVGYTLAFSGGTFLAIALTDLLPELHFHSHDRHKLSAALLIGLVVMWVASLIGHGEHHATHEPSAAEHKEHSPGGS